MLISFLTGERMVVWENLGMKPSANQFAELSELINNSFFFEL